MRFISYQQQTTPMYGGTMYQSPPMIGNIGSYGYTSMPYQNVYTSPYQNNGYYYNQYFNPQYMRQQQEAQRRLAIEEANTQAEIWAELIQCRNNAFGYEPQTKEVIIDMIKVRSAEQKQMDADEQFMDKVHEITQRVQQKKIEEQAIQENIARQQQVMQQQEEHREKKSFYQWLHEDALDRYMEAQYAELRRQARDTSNLYNSNSYNMLLNVHDSVFSAFNALKKDVTVDDMEIQVSLPEHLRRERDIRRQRFAESLRRGVI